jgi:hypothetical protein
MKTTVIRTLAIIALLVGTMLLGAYWFFTRDPRPPAVATIHRCAGFASETQGIKAPYGIRFSVSEKAFAIRSFSSDMPPEKDYAITLKGADAEMIVAHDDGIWPDLRDTSPIFSRRVADRSSRSIWARAAGKDTWGYLKSGERWRYVAFSTGDAIGYRPVPPSTAALFDQIMSSACTDAPLTPMK